MSKYTTQSKVASFLQRKLTSDEEAIFDMINENISQVINQYLNRDYNSIQEPTEDLPEDTFDEPTSSVRLFDGNNGKELLINDFVSVSKIELLDSQGEVSLTITSDSDFIKYPLNASIYESIFLRNYKFPDTGAANVQITAVFSSGDVPSAVIAVATALVANFLQEVPNMVGGYKQESIEGYSYSIKTASDNNSEKYLLLHSLDGLKKYIF
jgi:hypothetical protein